MWHTFFASMIKTGLVVTLGVLLVGGYFTWRGIHSSNHYGGMTEFYLTTVVVVIGLVVLILGIIGYSVTG